MVEVALLATPVRRLAASMASKVGSGGCVALSEMVTIWAAFETMHAPSVDGAAGEGVGGNATTPSSPLAGHDSVLGGSISRRAPAATPAMAPIAATPVHRSVTLLTLNRVGFLGAAQPAA
eukprot:gene28073-57283_t